MKHKNANKTKLPQRFSLQILVLSVLLALILTTGGYFYIHRNKPSDNTQPLTADDNPLNLNPPTEEERQQAEHHKDQIIDEQNKPESPAGEKGKLNPTIVDANQYNQAIEVRAFVGAVENNGQCVVTFKQGTAAVSKQVTAIPDASTTRCTNISVPRSEFASPGTWDVTVTYNSPKSQGSSSTKITVQ
jgi:hypothetical protein